MYAATAHAALVRRPCQRVAPRRAPHVAKRTKHLLQRPPPTVARVRKRSVVRRKPPPSTQNNRVRFSRKPKAPAGLAAASPPGAFLCISRGGTRTRTGLTPQGILSPLCLP